MVGLRACGANRDKILPTKGYEELQLETCISVSMIVRENNEDNGVRTKTI
jgi:hypothetical protein